jgi:hypothetical protein
MGGGGGAGGEGWLHPHERAATPRRAMSFFIDQGMEAPNREKVIVRKRVTSRWDDDVPRRLPRT